MPLFGEMNVRNALAAAASAIHAVERWAGRTVGKNIPAAEAIAAVLEGFSGFALPKRRLEIIGSWRGATVVDDFAHHPTAIAETLRAAVQKFTGRRIIACFEPRSNTTTRSIFQKELAECFAGASAVVIGALNRPERYAVKGRLNVSDLQKDLKNRGIPTFILPESDYSRPDWGAVIAAHLVQIVRNNDVILLFSNGNLGGLRELLK
jgi:UDP-N-acetylmuramate: L-alanyl-gamma-D-glutamyl-meso-diaminopimelate ligase